MPNRLPETWKNDAVQTSKRQGRKALARRLTTWLALSTAAVAGISRVAQATRHYWDQDPNATPKPVATAGGTGTWETTSATFWLPSTPADTLWNDGTGAAAGDTTVYQGSAAPRLAPATNFLAWQTLFQTPRFSAAGTPFTLGQTGSKSGFPAAGADLFLSASGSGVDWSGVGSGDDGSLPSGEARGDSRPGFLFHLDADLFGASSSAAAPGAFALAAGWGDAARLNGGSLAPESGFDADLLAANLATGLVPIYKPGGSPDAPAYTGATFTAFAPFTSAGTLSPGNPAADSPTIAVNAVSAGAPFPAAGAGNILPPNLPEMTSTPQPPAVKFRTSKVKAYEADLGASGNATFTSTAIASGVTTGGVTTGSTSTGGSITSVGATGGGLITSGTSAETGGGTLSLTASSGSTYATSPSTGALSISSGSGTLAASTPSYSFQTATTTLTSDSLINSSSTVLTSATVLSSASTTATVAPVSFKSATVNLVETAPTTPAISAQSAATPLISSPNLTTQVLIASLGSPDKIVSIPTQGTVNTVASAGSLANPEGLAFSLSGNLLVANNNGTTVGQYSLSINGSGAVVGTAQPAFASTGLDDPTGMATDSSGNLYVANTGTTANPNSYIEKFSSTGIDLGVFNTSGVLLNTPNGLAFDKSGNLYVANTGGNTVDKITSAGAVSTFIVPATYTQPVGLAFDSSGNLYVTFLNGSTLTATAYIIEKYSSTGTDLGTFVTENVLATPVGLAFDSSGDLYVAESALNKIEEYSSTGTDLGTFASGLSDPEYLAFATITIPEPDPIAMLLTGTAGLALLRRRRRPTAAPADRQSISGV